MKRTKKSVTLKTYDASASEYAKNTADLHPKEEAQKFLERLPTGAKILDIGCGPGRDVKVFSGLGFEVVGIDYSPKMIELAKQNAPRCSFHVMDIEKVTFLPETFHGAWANCSLLHIPKEEIADVLDKIYALLKPKGVLYLSAKQSYVSESFEADPRYGGQKKYWSFYEPDELAGLLRRAKFHILDIVIANKSIDYETHAVIKILCEKI